jgi:hypothetical protein
LLVTTGSGRLGHVANELLVLLRDHEGFAPVLLRSNGRMLLCLALLRCHLNYALNPHFSVNSFPEPA